MKRMTVVVAAVLLVFALGQGASAQKRSRQSDEEIQALRQEIESLKEGQKAIQSELGEIKAMLREIIAGRAAGAPPRPTVVSVDDDPSVGESTARVVLIDFSDYQ